VPRAGVEQREAGVSRGVRAGAAAAASRLSGTVSGRIPPLRPDGPGREIGRQNVTACRAAVSVAQYPIDASG
jgi:hypothetical protein